MNHNADSLDGPQRSRNGAAVLDPSDVPTTSRPPAHDHRGDGRSPRIGLFLLIAAGLVIAAFVFGLLPRLHQKASVVADTHELAVPTVNVVTASPAKASAPLVLSGELRPIAEASIYARASGYVRKWNVDIGQEVKQGDILAELDTPELDRDLAQARAELAQADAARALAESTAKRWKEMLSGKTVSTQEADEKFADVELKRAIVEAMRAKQQRLADLFGYSKITAPFAGTITARQIDVGQLINAGSGKELFRLAQTSKLRVLVRVPQSYARATAVGQVADVVVPEVPGRQFAGKILRNAGAMDAASRTLLVEIEVDNADGALLAGSYAQVRLTDARPEAALTLPSGAVLFRAEGPQVALVVDGRTSMRKVTLGRDFGPFLEVVGGVTPEDKVIMNPADSLVDGVEVRVGQPASVPAQ